MKQTILNIYIEFSLWIVEPTFSKLYLSFVRSKAEICIWFIYCTNKWVEALDIHLMFSSQNLGKYDGCVCVTFIPKVFEINVYWAYKADCYIRDSKYLVTQFFRL